MSFRASARFGLLLAIALLASARTASAAGGAYAVDDAAVDSAGNCKVESWLSFASNSDFIAAVTPACAFEVVRPIELSVQYARTRADREWGTSLSPKAKINLLPVETGKVGLAVSVSTSFDLLTGENTGTTVNVPVTFVLTDTFRINLNGGWFHDRLAQLDYATYGAGIEWNPVKPVTFIAEVFGLAGERTDPRSVTDPRAQAGVRFTPVDHMDIDLIYGRNITGENAHWVTLGLNYRFSVAGK
jgi:hypothetical protein